MEYVNSGELLWWSTMEMSTGSKTVCRNIFENTRSQVAGKYEKGQEKRCKRAIWRMLTIANHCIEGR